MRPYHKCFCDQLGRLVFKQLPLELWIFSIGLKKGWGMPIFRGHIALLYDTKIIQRLVNVADHRSLPLGFTPKTMDAWDSISEVVIKCCYVIMISWSIWTPTHDLFMACHDLFYSRFPWSVRIPSFPRYEFRQYTRCMRIVPDFDRGGIIVGWGIDSTISGIYLILEWPKLLRESWVYIAGCAAMV